MSDYVDRSTHEGESTWLLQNQRHTLVRPRLGIVRICAIRTLYKPGRVWHLYIMAILRRGLTRICLWFCSWPSTPHRANMLYDGQNQKNTKAEPERAGGTCSSQPQ